MLLTLQVVEWLSRAEKIKEYLSVSKLNTHDTSQTEEDEEAKHLSDSSE